MSTEMVTVKQVGEGSPWQHGITYYPVVFDRNGQDCQADWGKKGPAPLPGESVEGEFTDRNGELKFKKASADFQGGSPTGTSTSGSQDYPRNKQKSPDTQASIVRQHSQEMALRVLSHVDEEGGWPYDELRKVVKDWTDFFEQDANEAGGIKAADLAQATVQKAEAELGATPVAAGKHDDDLPF